MKKLLLTIMALGFVGTFVFSLSIPANAATPLQQTLEPSPTAGPDGRIIYTVLPGDSPWLISAKFGIPYTDLLALNGWGANEVLQPGQEVLLGLGGPVDATQPPAITPIPVTEGPTPTLGPGTAEVCILLFDDANGDALRQDSEGSIAGGAVSLSERTGLYSSSDPTLSGFDDDGLPLRVCYDTLPEGEYSISVAVPEGYNPTTQMDISFPLNAGDESTLNFGAQLSSQAAAANPSVEEGGRSPLLGVIGIALLLAGIGLGIFSTRMGR